MKYKRFEDLPVWKDAIAFAVKVFEFTSKASEFKGLGDLKNQLERAAVSVSNNIAEGFERGTTTELINFTYIAKGSAGECRSLTYVLGNLKEFVKFRDDVLFLRKKGESIARQLSAWADSLKDSGIKGTKFLTSKERKLYAQRRDREEFNQEMAAFRKEFEAKLKREEWERSKGRANG